MTDFTLKKHPAFRGIDGALLLVILDGVGLYKGRAEGYEGNAVDIARTPNFDRLVERANHFIRLKAHGTAVGLPSDEDMGNSEVGHNALGAGRVFDQGAKLVSEAIESGRLFEGPAWKEIVAQAKGRGAALHFIGLLSDGNVHSHIHHLFALLRRAAQDGVGKIRVHPLADGRDVNPVTFHLYGEQLESVLAGLRAKGCDARVASGGGRMTTTMDRYNADWEMVRCGWRTHVLGEGRAFKSLAEAIQTLRAEKPGVIDQDLPAFVIADEQGKPVGPIVDGDAAVFFNFRGDRAIEISRAFAERDFKEFDRVRAPKILYAGMMEYDGDLHIPPRYLVEPPAISRTVSEYLAKNGVRQLAVAETQKYGHVTYFWNGNNSEKFDSATETWVEAPSDRISFDKKPAMKAREVCQVVLEALESGRQKFIRVNFANGDMVGHTGNLAAAVEAMETVDECLGRLDEAVRRLGATMIVTADHGNCDQMYEVDKKSGKTKLDAQGRPVVKTSHTLNPVPWVLVGKHADEFTVNTTIGTPGLGHVAATLLTLLGYEPPADYLPALVLPK
ncbi:MAG: 2,3-bisphosphoglycerate-independent phosphoglycerate mutase [Myxococcales bacterium]|nr:MAG: 2,3-bisphosphoglycerate-independent phosphoglycerate mutase [Myxococcales bacterium]